jgi:hypothetical protein
MADYGVTDKALAGATGTDETLDKAIEYYLDETSEEEEGYEEDNWDYGDSED